MLKFGEWIVKHRALILIIGVLLLIPSTLGYVKTRVNYDILSYLPDDIELPEGPEESPRSRRKARTSESGIPQKDSSSRPPTRSMSAAKRQAFWPPPLV